jgi:hypothetical protein
MSNRFVLALALPLAFSLTACQSTEGPASPAVPRGAPAFDAGTTDAGVIEPGSDAQVVDMPSGSDFICVGAATGVFDDILVPAGAFCAVFNAVVHGNIKALQDATLAVINSQVRGNIDGDKADVVQIRGNRIGGSIQIKEGGPHPVSIEALVCNNVLSGGNIQIEKMVGILVIGLPTRPPIALACGNNGNTLEKGNIKVEDNVVIAGKPQSDGMDIDANRVRENLQVFKNRGPGVKGVRNNTVGESLQCFDNTPPFVGGPNVARDRAGQCF